MKNFLYCTLIIGCIFSCRKEPKPQPNTSETSRYTLEYASSFSLDSSNHQLVYKIHNKDTEKAIAIDFDKLPLQNIVTTSSSAVAYLDALNQTDKIKAAYDTEWIYSPTLQEQIKNNNTQNFGNANGMDLEQLLLMKPDAIIAFTDPNKTALYDQLEQNGIQVIYVDEYLEQTPLGKAEYIKFYGILTGTPQEANKLFEEVETNYKQAKEKVASVAHKPTILANIMRGDVWYLPGGKSFSAKLFEDAGGDYLWHEDTTEGSINKNFEEVFHRAEKADYWLNASNLDNLKELDAAHKNHSWFKAYKEGKVYSFAKRTSPNGANDYFETGTVRPDLVLEDLISILHPEILPNHELFFYQKLD